MPEDPPQPSGPADPKALSRTYDRAFRGGEAYRGQLPDTQNADSGQIKGAPVRVQQVGVANFRLPMVYAGADGSKRELETRLSGSVRLHAGVRGINMSRIIRTFYPHRETPVTPALLQSILGEICRLMETDAGRLRLDFSYPIPQASLRSEMEGFQYYPTGRAILMDGSTVRHFLYFDFLYSSACPGSAELADHATTTRGAYAIPHSQRSIARLETEIAPGRDLSPEALLRHCAEALQTEVQVMVRRDDEQAFAELNGAYPKFVEDAARLLFQALDGDPAIADFRVTCEHWESLHAHDAVARVVKGVPGGFIAE